MANGSKDYSISNNNLLHLESSCLLTSSGFKNMPISEVFNKDCMEGMQEYPDKFFELAIVDPPYGIDIQNSGRKKEQAKLRGEIIYDDSLPPNEDYFKELFRVSKNQIIWGGNHFPWPISRGWAVWDKKPMIPNYSDCELAWTSFDSVIKRKIIPWVGKFRTGIEKGYIRIHPSQKPLELYRWLLSNYAKEGDKILDTHLGSGSSRIAAYDMGFDFTGFEIDKDYFEAAEKRFQLFKSQQKLQFA